MSERRELHTWQQIADYLGLSIRALQNYERDGGLPVHRLAGQPRGRVWAFTDELDAWKAKALAGHGGTLLTTPPGGGEPSLPASLFPFPFSGHWRHAIVLCGLFALMWAEAVVLEIAYQFAAHRTHALPAALVVFGWVLAALLSALMGDWWRTANSKGGGLFLSVAIVYGNAALLQLALTWILPATAVTEQVARQPWSAQAAYLKNVVLYFLPLATFYILLPFHFVLALKREIDAKQHKPVLALLSGEPRATAPGAVYLRVGWLAVALFAAALLAVVMTQDLFDHLKPSRFKELFMYLALGRTLLTFGIAILWLLWYSRTLNEIKQECLRGLALLRPG